MTSGSILASSTGATAAELAGHAPEESPVRTAPLSPLRADSSCCNFLNWRCDLQPQAAAGPLQEQLLAHGYVLRCNHSGLRVFRHPAGHEVAWVPASGRVQIRVHLTFSPEQRRAAADTVYEDLRRSLTP